MRGRPSKHQIDVGFCSVINCIFNNRDLDRLVGHLKKNFPNCNLLDALHLAMAGLEHSKMKMELADDSQQDDFPVCSCVRLTSSVGEWSAYIGFSGSMRLFIIESDLVVLFDKDTF